MRTLLIALGVMTAATVVWLPTHVLRESDALETSARAPSPHFKWTQVAPPGSGTHQHEWKKGTYPSALAPIAGLHDGLWMVGQKKAWFSSDGIQWKDFDKKDWGERISMASVAFDGKLWVSGGMDYTSGTFLNEIWYSADGKGWTRSATAPDWSPRKGHTLTVFRNKLWLFGGAVTVNEDKTPKDVVNDIWSSVDGIQWKLVRDSAPWPARYAPSIVVFKEELWLVGGHGHSDVWRSSNGIDWRQVAADSPWNDRYDHGVAVFNDLLWVYGGREAIPRNAYNDAWFSQDGVTWHLQAKHTPWTPRSGNNAVVFRNKLWLYGGKHTGHEDSFSGDTWTLEVLNGTSR